LISTLLSAVYYLKIIRKVFFGAPQEEHHQDHPIKEVSLFVIIPLLLSAMISVVLGIYPNFLLELVRLVLQ
jgi:multicomponent Na+:H+ antiporter subunit D